MASTFPAAIANEPPPLDASSEDEDSEEFRSHGLKLDVPSGEPTPVSTPFKRPLNKSLAEDKVKTTERNNRVYSVSPEECNHSSKEVYADDQDEHVKTNGIEDNLSVAPEDKNYNTPFHEETIKQSETDVEQTSNNCDSSTNVNYNSNSPQSLQLYVDTESPIEDEVAERTGCDDDEYPCETSKSTDQESSVGDFHTFGKENCSPASTSDDIAEEKSDEFQECQVYELETTVVEEDENLDKGINDSVNSNVSAFVQTKSTTTTLETKQDDDNFGDGDDFGDDDDFGAFQSIPQPPLPQETAIESIEEEGEDDDFGDFAQISVQTSKTIPPPVTQLRAQTSQEEFEDFADFQDCSFQSCDGATTSFAKSPSVPSDLTLITSKIDSIVKSLFVIDSSLENVEAKKPISIDSEIIASSDSTWARVQDFEGSHGLMFKWLNSLTGKRLLRSLNINTSNIMYHEKWGTIEVPKFAASLVQSPLQPQSCNKLESQAKSAEDHPAILNNNTIISDDHHDKPPTISTEAQEILRQLPDLSYMRANTLVFPQSSPSGL